MNLSRYLSAVLVVMALGATPLAATSDADRRSRDRNYFTDVVLTTHDGEEMRLYSDLMEDKIVVISAFFTTCVGVCPVTAMNLQKIQTWLGPRLGEDVVMLSMTVDPETDDLAKLGEYADSVEAKPGWYFLTGEKDNLELALSKLGLKTNDKEAHSPVFLIGNLRTGLWKKALGMASSADLIKIVESVIDDNIEKVVTGPVRPGR